MTSPSPTPPLSSDLCQAVLDALAPPVLVLNRKGRILYANKASSKRFGPSITGAACYYVLPEPPAQGPCPSCPRQGESSSSLQKTPFPCSRASFIPLEGHGAWLLTLSQDPFPGGAPSPMDPPETAEAIISSSPIPTFVIDRNHRIIHWNKACERLTGFRKEEMIGTDRQWEPFYPYKRPIFADLLIEGDYAAMERFYKPMKLRPSSIVEEAYEAEAFFPHLGEGGAYLYFNTAPLRDAAGAIQGAVVMYLDLTEKVRMLEELRLRRDFERHLIHHSIDGIIATDREGKIAVFNPSASEILGYQPEETIGRLRYRDLLRPETARAIREAFYSDQFGPKGKIVNMTTSLVNKAGEPIPVRFSGSLLMDEGREIGSVVFIQDLREILRLQREKERAERMAAIGRAMAALAHHIKNVLAGLQGGAYVIESGLSKKDPDLTAKGWRMVQRNIEEVGAVAQDMLLYSTERSPVLRPEDPNALVRDVLALMEPRARSAGVRLIHRLDPTLPPVPMDGEAIRRCLTNLVANAIDACVLEGVTAANGEVRIATDRVPGWGVRFAVEDNGIGMDQATQDALLKDFYPTKGYKGSGLGLLVTQKIVEEHGGRLEFTTRQGEGSVFAILLPAPGKGDDDAQGATAGQRNRVRDRF